MKRILMLPFIMLVLISSAFAVSFEFDSGTNEIITAYDQKEKFTKFFYLVDPLDDSKTVSGSNFTFDEKIELFDVTDEIYLIYDNPVINQTIRVGVFNSEGGLVSQVLTLNEVGSYYFLITPSFSGEDFSILFDSTSPSFSVLYLESDKESEFFGLFAPLITGTHDLLTLNITIIRTLFYIFVFVVVVLIVAGLFWGGFKVLSISEKINKKKGVFDNTNETYKK